MKVAKKISVPVTLTFLKGRLAERNRVEGDLLVVRSKFLVKRDDFGINPGQKLLKVANVIDIRVGIAGGKHVQPVKFFLTEWRHSCPPQTKKQGSRIGCPVLFKSS